MKINTAPSAQQQQNFLLTGNVNQQQNKVDVPSKPYPMALASPVEPTTSSTRAGATKEMALPVALSAKHPEATMAYVKLVRMATSRIPHLLVMPRSSHVSRVVTQLVRTTIWVWRGAPLVVVLIQRELRTLLRQRLAVRAVIAR